VGGFEMVVYRRVPGIKNYGNNSRPKYGIEKRLKYFEYSCTKDKNKAKK
jgi:hypothetical protein